MKALFISLLFCTCLTHVALAQKSTVNAKPLIIVNDAPYHKDITKLNPNIIQKLSIVKPEYAIEKYGQAGKNGAMVIITKLYMVTELKRRISIFSKEYKDYIASNPDHNITYVLNGEVMKGDSRSVGIVLYDIPDKQIREVKFTQSENNDHDNTPTVNITTLQH